MLIGLTGGIATGKSTVSKLLEEKGAHIIDADQIARDVVEPGTIGSLRVREHFGDTVFFPDGTLHRSALGAIIFNDANKRKELEKILHPLIRQEMKARSQRYLQQNQQAIVVWDVPLLFESQLTTYVEKVIVVYVSKEIQLERLRKRDNLSQTDALQRVESQISIEQKREWADFVIDNQGSYKNTESQVDQLWKSLILKNGLSQP